MQTAQKCVEVGTLCQERTLAILIGRPKFGALLGCDGVEVEMGGVEQ